MVSIQNKTRNTYTAEQRKTQHDRLTSKHVKGTEPSNENLLGTESVLFQFIGAVNVRLTSLATPLSFTVEKNGLTGLWNNAHVHKLCDNTENELNPENPVQSREVFLLTFNSASDKATNEGADGGTNHRRQYDECNSVLLVVDLEQICDDTKSDTATGREETTEETCTNHIIEVWSETSPNLST